MDVLISDNFVNVLLISTTFSFVMMSLIQKFKSLSFINKPEHIWVINLVLSFVVGTLFGLHFYNLSVYDSIWMGLFSFIGAPSIYEALKKQNIINYTPKSLNSSITIKNEYIINRKDI